MKLRIALGMLAVAVCAAGVTPAQMPEPAAEHAILKHDVGTWDADAKIFMPGMPEEQAPGKEVNTMFGEFWLNSVYTMDFMGTKFRGQATVGYDQASKKYVGSWVDSMTPTAVHMSGTWDEASKTMTMMTTGMGPDGAERNGKMTTVYSDNGNKRVMTMYDKSPEGDGSWVKSMEVVYTRAKE